MGIKCLSKIWHFFQAFGAAALIIIAFHFSSSKAELLSPMPDVHGIDEVELAFEEIEKVAKESKATLLSYLLSVKEQSHSPAHHYLSVLSRYFGNDYIGDRAFWSWVEQTAQLEVRYRQDYKTIVQKLIERPATQSALTPFDIKKRSGRTFHALFHRDVSNRLESRGAAGNAKLFSTQHTFYYENAGHYAIGFEMQLPTGRLNEKTFVRIAVPRFGGDLKTAAATQEAWVSAWIKTALNAKDTEELIVTNLRNAKGFHQNAAVLEAVSHYVNPLVQPPRLSELLDRPIRIAGETSTRFLPALMANDINTVARMGTLLLDPSLSPQTRSKIWNLFFEMPRDSIAKWSAHPSLGNLMAQFIQGETADVNGKRALDWIVTFRPHAPVLQQRALELAYLQRMRDVIASKIPAGSELTLPVLEAIFITDGESDWLARIDLNGAAKKHLEQYIRNLGHIALPEAAALLKPKITSPQSIVHLEATLKLVSDLDLHSDAINADILDWIITDRYPTQDPALKMANFSSPEQVRAEAHAILAKVKRADETMKIKLRKIANEPKIRPRVESLLRRFLPELCIGDGFNVPEHEI